ncbi:MAG: hypothetical protein JW768_06485 [Chitinispirillaceae bacterium]|nr:hypothetical protein [Chitinispirillaceae bacterium]
MKRAVRNVLFSVISFTVTTGLAAEPWKVDINTNIATTLNTYSDNWTGGEAGSFTWAGLFLGIAEKQISDKLNTKSTLKMQFGQTKIQEKTSKEWSVPEKSTDLIDAEELFRFTLGLWVDPFISARAISQFLDRSDPLLERYVNPADITEAAGISRTLKKTETVEWSSRLGGAARQYVDRQKLDSITGDRENDITNDGGVEFNMDLKAMNKEKCITLLSSLRIYEALVSSKADEFEGTDMENDWRYPHVKWENTLTLTFAKYLMLNVSAYAYYDKDIDDDVRLKETFQAGLTYIFSKK